MREFKFRAWDESENKMRVVRAIEWDNYGGLGVDYASDKMSNFAGGSETLMQFTGLKDKNGKEIYEGDIVEYPSQRLGASKKETERGFIGYRDEDLMYWIYLKNDRTSFTGAENMYHGAIVIAEIIGNIHENSELLKQD